MGKSVSQDQSHAVIATLQTNVDWSVLDGDVLQEQIIRNPREAGKQFTLFLKNGARVIIGGLKIVTAPFDPKEFLGEDWGDYPKEQDKESAALKEVDLGEVEFITCLNEGEVSIKGEEKLARLKKSGRIRYGNSVFMGLWLDYQARKKNSVLERLYQKKNISYMDFFGDIPRVPDGRRGVFYLYRHGDGVWDWGCRCLDGDCAGVLSVVSPQVKKPLDS